MRIAIRIFLVLGVIIALITFTINPFRKRAGMIIIFLGIVASFAVRLMLGIPMVIIGALFLLIHFLYHRCC